LGKAFSFLCHLHEQTGGLGDHFVSLFDCFIVFPVSDLRKLALTFSK
jgi:hypothetical protein